MFDLLNNPEEMTEDPSATVLLKTSWRSPDILIGANLHHMFSISRLRSLSSGAEILQSSIGVGIFGPLPREILSGRSQPKVICSLTNAIDPCAFTGTDDAQEKTTRIYKSQMDESLRRDLERIWRWDILGLTPDPCISDGDKALAIFEANIKFCEKERRYVAAFPMIEGHPPIPSGEIYCKNRFVSGFKNLTKKPDSLIAYDKVFKKYEANRVSEDVTNLGVKPGKYPRVYINHHAVWKEGKKTPRPVFDASACPVKGAPSLNQCMHVGPVAIFMPQIIGLTCRFRTELFVVLSDIQAAFHQILLAEHQRNLTCHYWVRDITLGLSPNNIRVYRFRSVPFGMTGSPFILLATIRTHLKRENSPLASELIRNTFVDNLMLTAPTREIAKQKAVELKRLFAKCSMNVRDFVSNDTALNHELSKIFEQEVPEPLSKFLGIPWHVEEDVLLIPNPVTQEDFSEIAKITKRKVAKKSGQLYDPLGVIGPAVVKTKFFMQKLWQKSYGWDIVLDSEDAQEWKSILEGLQIREPIRFPRFVPNNPSKDVFQWHVFTDASKLGMCAVVYLVVVDSKGHKHSHLIHAKCKVNPLKPVSMARLELTGVTLGVRLLSYLRNEVNVATDAECFLWTDSLICIGWCQSMSLTLPLYVKNRVKEIRSFSGLKIGHVPGELNPADLGSRSVPLEALRLTPGQHHSWWHGPKFLIDSNFPDSPKEVPQYPVDAVMTIITQRDVVIDLSRYSTLRKAIRCAAYVLRFVGYCARSKQINLQGICSMTLALPKGASLTFEDLDLAEKLLIWLDQSLSPPTAEHIYNLNLYKDSDGIWHCADRLQNTPEGPKQPIFLAPKSSLVKAALAECHRLQYHGKLNPTLSCFYKTFWSPKARQCAKQVIRKCIICRKHSPKVFKLPSFPPLPRERLIQANAFTFCGVDGIGAFTVRVKPKSKETIRVTAVLFTCFVCRGVYIDLLENNSADAFIHTLRRFIARRGCPKIIASDHGTNFVLASKVLSELEPVGVADPVLSEFLSARKITWKFITELSPWKGAIWERLVGLTKKALRFAIGRKCLTVEEARTVLAECEAVLNSRALTYVDEPPHTTIMRPIDLIGNINAATLAMYEPHSLNVDDFRLGNLGTKEKLTETHMSLSQYTKRFWSMFFSHYVPMLRQRYQRDHKQKHFVPRELILGEVVTLVTPQSPPGIWPLARVIEMPENTYGPIRHVVLKTKGGNRLTRPISLIAPLEAHISEGEGPVPGNSEISSRDNSRDDRDCRVGVHVDSEQGHCTSPNDDIAEASTMEHLQPDQVPPDQVPPADESVDHPGDPDGGQRMGGDGVLSNNPKAQDETDQLVEPLGLLDLSSEGKKECGRNESRYALRPRSQKWKDFLKLAASVLAMAQLLLGIMMVLLCLVPSAHAMPAQSDTCWYPPRDIPLYPLHSKKLISEYHCQNGTFVEHTAFECKEQDEIEFIEGKPCFKRSVFVYRKKDKTKFCYKAANCVGHSPHVQLKGQDIGCGTCKCPSWATECTHFTEADIRAENLLEGHDKYIVLDNLTQHKMLAELRPNECRIGTEQVTERNKHCTKRTSVKLHLIQLPDLSEHYVEELHVQKREVVYAKERCFGVLPEPKIRKHRRDMTPSLGMKPCADSNGVQCKLGANKFCYHPLTEIATVMVKNALAIPVFAWGTVSAIVYRPEETPATSEFHCVLCTLKCEPEQDSFAIGWDARVNHVEFCSAKGCENLQVFANVTGLRRKFIANEKVPRFVRAQWWWDGVLVKSDDTICPYPDPCKKLDCYFCKKFADHPQCHPLIAVVTSVIILYGICYALLALVAYLYRRYQRRTYNCQRKSRESLNTLDNAIAMRDLRMVEYRSIPRDDEEGGQVTFRRSSTRQVPSLASISLESHENRLGPIIEEAELEEDVDMYVNYPSSSAPHTELMRREIQKLQENLAGARQELEAGQGVLQRRGSGCLFGSLKSLAGSVANKMVIVAMLAGLLVATHACSVTTSLGSMTETCVQTGKDTMECKFRSSLLMSFQTGDHSYCVLLSDNNPKPIGHIRFTVSEVKLVCKPAIRYYTRDYKMSVTSSKRCLLAGSCQLGSCSNTTLQADIPELGAVATHSPGFTYCQDSSGCWTAGCFICENSCLFYRVHATAIDDKIGTVYSCPSWEIEVSLKIEITRGNHTAVRMTSLRLDTPQLEIEGMSLVLTSLTMPPATYLNEEFITDGRRTALLPKSGSLRTLECDSVEAAHAFNNSCKLPASMCSCRAANNRAKCNCEERRPMLHLSDRASLVPNRIGSVLVKQNNGTVYTETSISDMQVQLSFDGFSLKTKVDNSKCSLEWTNLQGCGSCSVASELSYVCRTNQGESIGHVYCKTAKFAVHCDENGTQRKTYLGLPSGKFSESCRLICPNSATKHVIEGYLHLATDIDRTVETLISTNVSTSSSTLLEWLSVARKNIFSTVYVLYVLLTVVACITLSLLATLGLIWLSKACAPVTMLAIILIAASGGVSVRTEDERAIVGGSPGDHSMDTDVGSDVDDIASDDAETVRDDTSSVMVLSPRMESGENAPHAEADNQTGQNNGTEGISGGNGGQNGDNHLSPPVQNSAEPRFASPLKRTATFENNGFPSRFDQQPKGRHRRTFALTHSHSCISYPSARIQPNFR